MAFTRGPRKVDPGPTFMPKEAKLVVNINLLHKADVVQPTLHKVLEA